MTVQLFSIEHGPVSLPIWQAILDDLGNPPVARVARVLGVGRRTVYRYNRTGRPPRMALLALYWLTRWGRSAVHAQATNDAIMAVGYLKSLEAEVRELRAKLEHVVALGQSGAANDPLKLRGSDG